MEQAEDLQVFISTLYDLINGVIIDNENYYEFFENRLRMPKDSVRHLQAFSSIMAGNYMQCSILFDVKELQHVDKLLTESVVSLAIKRLNLGELEVIVSEVIKRKQLYTSKNLTRAL